MSVEPLVFEFRVRCDIEHAFRTWTERIDAWWPKDHSVSGEVDFEVVIEPGVGGSIFERTSTGAVHQWGKVTSWDPPGRYVYLWHIGSDSTAVLAAFTECVAG